MVQANKGHPEKFQCPCRYCLNLQFHHYEQVYEHLVINGIDPTYDIWVFHGETPNEYVDHEDVEMPEEYRMFKDAVFEDDTNADDLDVDQPRVEKQEANFETMVKDAELPLYAGCTYTKMSATVALFKLKARYNLSNNCYDEILELLGKMLPGDDKLPDSLYATKKLLKAFDLGYVKIHACVNDCCLYRKDKEDMEACPKCTASRWKVDVRTNNIQKGIPAKVLRYFPIIPRFRRMFKSPETAEQLRWHHSHKSRDGKMRHPVDSMAWNRIDSKWPEFASDPRNLRLGLSSDGFNPFSDPSTKYSMWPVILFTYNLPPWLCMSEENLMLTLLIPGKSQPGNDIDVYLEPLIEDLKELWTNGVKVHDSYDKSTFNLKAVLMWTINDFPAYGNLSGHTTKGKFACPICAAGTCSTRLPNSGKDVYMDHRRFLPPNHSFRKKKSWFNGKEEQRGRPKVLNGTEILDILKDHENDYGKVSKDKKKRKKTKENTNSIWPWKKKSIFFELPYWELLLLRHNLDLMHIEKNISESIYGTLLNIKGKTKDGLKSRKDLEHLGILEDLHPKPHGNKFRWATASYNLSKAEKKVFCKRLANLKLPDGYSSNISTRVSLHDCKISGLKSHDNHILLQQLLPVALRGLLPKGTRIAIFRLCSFFNEICQKVIDKNRLEKLESEVAETFCLMERFLPPSFFDVMVHLTIHLAREAQIGGPPQFRYMYQSERFMKKLKDYVKNRSRPEGCIAEKYLAEECSNFCSGYMKQATEIGNQYNRNEDFENETILQGRPISKGTSCIMNSHKLEIAHHTVLMNTAEVEPYIEIPLEELRRSDKRLLKNESLLQERHRDIFATWLGNKISTSQGDDISSTLRWLAGGPRKDVISYSGYIINGHRFHIKDVEKSTQNSGVCIEAETICRASAKDTSHIKGKVSHYGVIKDIILLDYYTFKIPLFECDWANIKSGVRFEEGFTLVNLHQGQTQFERDPFVLASHASQVFYSKDNDTSNWYVVLKATPRGFHDPNMFDDIAYFPSAPLDVSRLDQNLDDEDCVRRDCDELITEDEE